MLYVVRFSTATVDSLRAFQQDAYDLALYDQGIWLLSRFHAPFTTVMGTDMFAAHTVFIFVLLVPLYWVYPHAAALLVIQAMRVGIGAVTVYLLGRRLLRSTVLATLLAAAYFSNPAIQQGNLEQFHVEAFEAPILAFAVYAAVVWRPRLLIVMVFSSTVQTGRRSLRGATGPVGGVAARPQPGHGNNWRGVVVGLLENFLLVPALLTAYRLPTPVGGRSGPSQYGPVTRAQTGEVLGTSPSHKAVPGTCGRWRSVGAGFPVCARYPGRGPT